MQLDEEKLVQKLYEFISDKENFYNPKWRSTCERIIEICFCPDNQNSKKQYERFVRAICFGCNRENKQEIENRLKNMNYMSSFLQLQLKKYKFANVANVEDVHKEAAKFYVLIANLEKISKLVSEEPYWAFQLLFQEKTEEIKSLLSNYSRFDGDNQLKDEISRLGIALSE
ncbi:hypothetical protein FACS18942_01420 [Planctomycetales bacterium]|nr:hypothetical protein FACS18942_01420 [Planctomycetales bacterium]GHT34905.1 hypothetical protein FACS189427_03100 [Planctomycetales bacterium]